MGTKVRPAVVAVLLLFLTACADQGKPVADGSSTTTPQTTANATGSSAAADVGECPAGTYQVTSLTARDSVTVSGQQVRVADVTGLTLEFTADGTWTLSGTGATITVSAAGLTARATLTGSATGGYAESGGRHVFTQTSSRGRITLDQPVAGVRSIPMSEFGPAIAPSGTATITCTATGATISAENATLELAGGTGAETGAEPTATEPTAAEPTGGDPAPAVVNGSGKTGSYNCTGGPVTINGSNNALTFTGACEAVNVNGDSNQITLATADVVTVNGAQNRLTWTGTEPQVIDNGRGNSVTRG